jgi:hypothetical protein
MTRTATISEPATARLHGPHIGYERADRGCSC